MLKHRLAGLSKYLKRISLGLGVLVLLFLIANVVLGFSPKKIRQIKESWCHVGLQLGIVNDIRTLWCDSGVQDSALFIARAFSEIVEPPVQSQVEIVNWEFRLFRHDEWGKKILLTKWQDPSKASGTGSSWSSQVYALIKNTGILPIHGIDVKIKLYRSGNLISEVNPFESGRYSLRDYTDVYAYVPPGESYIFEPELVFPPQFDRAELEVKARPYQASIHADSFIPLDIEIQKFGFQGKDKFYPLTNGGYFWDNFGHEFRPYIYVNESDEIPARIYAVPFKITNNSPVAVRGVKLEGAFFMSLNKEYSRMKQTNQTYLERLLSEKVVKSTGSSANDWLSDTGPGMEDVTLDPGESVVVLRFMGIEDRISSYREYSPGWGVETTVNNDLKLKKTHYIYAWGEKAD